MTLPSYPPRPRSSVLDKALVGLVRALRGLVYASGRAAPPMGPERREAALCGVRALLARFEVVRREMGAAGRADGEGALVRFAAELSAAVEAREPSALLRGHEALLAFADWLEGALERPPRMRGMRRGRARRLPRESAAAVG